MFFRRSKAFSGGGRWLKVEEYDLFGREREIRKQMRGRGVYKGYVQLRGNEGNKLSRPGSGPWVKSYVAYSMSWLSLVRVHS